MLVQADVRCLSYCCRHEHLIAAGCLHSLPTQSGVEVVSAKQTPFQATLAKRTCMLEPLGILFGHSLRHIFIDLAASPLGIM